MECRKQISRRHLTLWNMNSHRMTSQRAHWEHFQRAVGQCFHSFFLSSPSTSAWDFFLSSMVSLCGCHSPCRQPLAAEKIGLNAEIMEFIFCGFVWQISLKLFCQTVIALLTVSRAFTSGKSHDRQWTPGRESYCQCWVFRVKTHWELLLPLTLLST